MDKQAFDVIIIDGRYEGLSTVMTLGRSIRKSLVQDARRPCNRLISPSHNFLTQNGSTP